MWRRGWWIEKRMMVGSSHIFMNMQHVPLYSLVMQRRLFLYCGHTLLTPLLCFFVVQVSLYTHPFLFVLNNTYRQIYFGKYCGSCPPSRVFLKLSNRVTAPHQLPAWSDLMTQLLCSSLAEIKGNKQSRRALQRRREVHKTCRWDEKGSSVCTNSTSGRHFLTDLIQSARVPLQSVASGCCMHAVQ